MYCAAGGALVFKLNLFFFTAKVNKFEVFFVGNSSYSPFETLQVFRSF